MQALTIIFAMAEEAHDNPSSRDENYHCLDDPPPAYLLSQDLFSGCFTLVAYRCVLIDADYLRIRSLGLLVMI